MENLNLYYNTRLLSSKNKRKYIAIPVVEKNIDFYLDRKKLNLYQEIALELFKCGHGNIKSIEEVLKLDIFDDKENTENDIEGLSHYIVKELKQLGYVKDGDITAEGKEILKENLDDEKMLGSIFFNKVSGEYMNFLMINKLYEIKDIGVTFDRHIVTQKDIRAGSVNLGTLGSRENLKITFLDEDMKNEELNIEAFIKVIDGEIRLINRELGESFSEDGSFSSSSRTKFLIEKKKTLNEVRKFKIKSKKKSYVLVALEDGEVKDSFNPGFINYSLGVDLKGYESVKESLKEHIDEKFGASKQEKFEIRNKFNEKEKEIIEDSSEKLSLVPELVRKLSNLTGINSSNETDSEKEDKYGISIQLIYECFGEILLYLFEKYSKTTELSKKKNNELKLKNILRNKYKLPKELINCYTYPLNNGGIPYIKDNKKLKELFAYVIILEDKNNDNKLEEYINYDLSFFSFIKKLVDERNKFSHSGEDQAYVEDEMEYDFESEANNKLIDFIEKIFKFKFEDSLEIKVIDEEMSKKLKIQAQSEIDLKFSNNYTSEVWIELVDTLLNFKYYENFKISIYKALFMKKVGILLEKNLKLLREKLDKKLVLDNSLEGEKKIFLKDIDDKFFKGVSSVTGWINSEFNKIKDTIPIRVSSLEKTSRNFKKGTLNSYASVLLYSKDNKTLKEIRESCPEFFKLIFIVSNLRGHNGEFSLKSENSDKEEIEAVKDFLETVYKVQKRILEITGE